MADGRDNRSGTHVFAPGVAEAIRACTKSNSTAHVLLGSNAKTGSKLLGRIPVRLDIIKESSYKFLNFLKEYHDKGQIDPHLFFEADVAEASDRYGDKAWTDLVVEVEAPAQADGKTRRAANS